MAMHPTRDTGTAPYIYMAPWHWRCPVHVECMHRSGARRMRRFAVLLAIWQAQDRGFCSGTHIGGEAANAMFEWIDATLSLLAAD